MPQQVKQVKKTAKVAAHRKAGPVTAQDDVTEDQQKNTFTLSVRLTEEQKERLEIAARLRGWTPTTLLRVAAMEKAAHVLNTTTPTNMDLRKIAESVAARLTGQGKKLEIRELKALKMATHYGGSEFMNMVVDGCL